MFRRNLNRPTEGTGDWDDPLNENFAILEDKDVAYGAMADRPTAGSDDVQDGAVFVANDPNESEYGQVYRHNDITESWELVPREYAELILGDWDLQLSADGQDIVVSKSDTEHYRITDTGLEAYDEPTQDNHLARLGDVDAAVGDAWAPEDWHIIDVSDYGLDGTRSTDIVQFMIDNGPAKFYYPEGDYSIEQGFSANTQGWSQFAIVGLGDGADFYFENQDADDLVSSSYSSTSLDYAELRNFRLHVDAANDIDAGFARLACNERLIIEDIELVGTRAYNRLHPDNGGPGTHGSQYNLRVNMLGPDSVAHIRNVRFMDGGVGGSGADEPRVIPFSVEPPNEGTQIYDGCHVANWSGNGYYLKDGTGSSVLFGCSAKNIGGQGFRFGQQDMSIAGRTVTDSDIDNLDHGPGTHLDVHRAEGTAVMGHRCVDTYGGGELVRARAGNEQASIRDVFIYSTGTDRVIRTSSTDSGDDAVATHGEGKLVFDNIRIHIESDDTSATRVGAIVNRRANTVYRDVSTLIDVPNTSFASVVVDRGDAHFEKCRFTRSDTNSAGYNVIAGPNDSTETDLGRVEFTACEFDGQVFTYAGDPYDALSFVGCDFTTVADPWGRDDPTTIDSIDYLTIFRNPGLDTQTVNNQPLGVQTSAWDGSSMTVKFGDDVVDFISE